MAGIEMTLEYYQKLGYSCAPVAGVWPHGTTFKNSVGQFRVWDANIHLWLDAVQLVQGWLFDEN